MHTECVCVLYVVRVSDVPVISISDKMYTKMMFSKLICYLKFCLIEMVVVAGAFLLIVSVFTTQASITGYIGSSDQTRFLEALTRAFVKLETGDVDTVYYGAKGFNLLNQKVVTVLIMDSCAHLEHHFKKDSPPETAFHALSTWSLLGCKGKLHTDATINVS